MKRKDNSPNSFLQLFLQQLMPFSSGNCSDENIINFNDFTIFHVPENNNNNTQHTYFPQSTINWTRLHLYICYLLSGLFSALTKQVGMRLLTDLGCVKVPPTIPKCLLSFYYSLIFPLI